VTSPRAGARRTTLVLGAAALVGYGCLHRLGRTAGSTSAERRAVLPGDDLVADPHMVTDHAITIGAGADEVWRWYTPRWVDRLLFPGNWASLDRLDPRLVRELRVGDRIPDGPPGTAEYRVARVERPRTLVLHSTTHVPPGWDERYDARIDWTWSFDLRELPAGTTRVHLRVRGRMSPPWFAALYLALVVPADYVMAVGMLRGLAERVERDLPPADSGRPPFTDDEPDPDHHGRGIVGRPPRPP
jgi:hypothetical protein